MSFSDNYRSSLDYREILRILQKSTTLQENFLWQTHAMGRTVIPVKHFEIDFVSRGVVVYFDNQQYRLEPEIPVYVKLDYRTSVFKVNQFREGLNSVQFDFPQEIKTVELRGEERFQFFPDQIRTASIKPSLGGSRDGSQLQVRVMDVSSNGLGLVASEQNRAFLRNNRILWLTTLGDKELTTPILGEVVYMNNEVGPKFLTRKQKEMKVGFKLSNPLPEISYQKFIQ